MKTVEPKFSLGTVVITRAALLGLPPEAPLAALIRHQSGDWGEVGAEDRQANEDALRDELRLFSVYRASNGIKFWVITEWDRSITTILLPDDY